MFGRLYQIDTDEVLVSRILAFLTEEGLTAWTVSIVSAKML